MALRGVQLGDALAKAAGKLGLAAGELAGLRHAARLANVEHEALEGAVVKLGKAVSEAGQGLQTQKRAFDQLGVSIEEVRKLSLSEQMLKVGDALNGVTNQTDKLRIASDLFGRGAGANMLNLFKQGSSAIREQMEEARKYGTYIDSTQSRVVQEAADAQTRMRTAFEGLSMQLGATFGPAIEAASQFIADMTAKVTAALPKLAALAERFLGIKIAADDLSDSTLHATLIEQIQALDKINDKVAEQKLIQDKLGATAGAGVQEYYNDLLQQQADKQQRINELLAERVKRSKEQAAPDAALSEDDELFNEDEAKRAAAAELALVTAVYEERERLRVMEAEQEFSWATTMAEERERMHAEELAQEFEWATVLAEERQRGFDEELVMFYEHENLLTQARKEGALARLDFDKMSTDMQVKTVLGGMIAMTAGVAQHNKTLFKVNKAAALANAGVNTAQGVTRALAEFPPPVSFIMAGLQAAAGLAQIQAIKATSFGGGGTGTTPSAAGSTPVVNSQPVQQSAPSQRLVVEGISADSLFTGASVRNLAQRLLEFQSDGGKVVIQ
jgi:hypothetical protein